MSNALFSVIILCYRHFEYLYSAIDSVLSQDYPNIELIVSDDGSANFPKEKIEHYLEAHKGKNVSRVIVRQEEKNNGTVRHLNHVIQVCSGDYIVALAGDDSLWGDSSLSKYAVGFSHAPEGCLIEMAQTAMCDESLEKVQSFYLNSAARAALEKTQTDTGDLKHILIRDQGCLPSTSTCFKREFFEKFGPFDERYVLVEDYPMHIRLAEEGWVIHYENFVAIKHRHGGISHGRNNTLSRTSVFYFKDIKRTLEEIVFPNLGVLTEAERQRAVRKLKADLSWLDMQIAKGEGNWAKMLRLALRHPIKAYWWFTDKIWPIINKCHIKLLHLCAVMWAVIPTVSDMFALTFGLNALAVEKSLCGLTLAAFILWVFCFVTWWVKQLYWRLHRFPNETLAIG